VILACNTASAKALRTIQQHDLAALGEDKKVLGVIRPTAEIVGDLTVSGHVGVLGTTGTIESGSYLLEIEKFFPGTVVNQQACPMWVPLIENGEMDSEGARYFIRKDLGELLLKDSRIDTILLACTHYPLLTDQLKAILPARISLISQGNIVALSLKDYLKRHPEVEERCSKNGEIEFYTTDDTVNFDKHGALFFGSPISSKHIDW
jgi:glutamate racemase